MSKLVLYALIVVVLSNPVYRDGVPRFKTFEKPNHEVYLGDKVKLSCFALAKATPVVQWYRNGEYIDFRTPMAHRFRESRKHMTLEVKKAEVSDQGLWSCRVSNSIGYITRNFTIEIIDFCNYFLNYGIPLAGVPMECVCLWDTQKVRRVDVDYSVVNDANCLKYHQRIARHQRHPLKTYPCFNPPCDENGRSYADREVASEHQTEHVSVGIYKDPVRLFDYLVDNNMVDVGDLLPSLLPFTEKWELRWRLKGWKNLTLNQKIAKARKLVQLHSERAVDSEDEDDDVADVKSMENEVEKSPPSPPRRTDDTYRNYFSNFSGVGSKVEQAILTPGPDKILEKPYFKNSEETSRSLASPAGRTIRLSCKSGGWPEPRVIWYKNKALIVTDSPRASGSEYKIRKWSIEMEDTTENDSGQYMCEVWSGLGSIARYFNVTVVNRMRSPPLIVPNILVNQTVNVNGTAMFQCEVVSDLVPHIMWVRIEKNDDGKYYYYNETVKENMFRYTEMDSVQHAKIIKRKDASTLVLESVTVDDQAIYACITGNSLGTAMANATLFVNDFHAMEIPTGIVQPQTSVWSIVSMVSVFLMFAILLGVIVSYFTCLSPAKLKDNDDESSLIPHRKKIVVTHKKHIGDGNDLSDLTSTYQIQIVEESAKGRRPRLSSDMTQLDEYEISTDPKYEIARERVHLVDIIGSGAFGEVYKALLDVDPKKNMGEPQLPVAVKRVKKSATEKDLVALVGEMEMFKAIGQHENMLRLIGCSTGVGPLYVILELCVHGNLRDFLRAHRPREEKATLPNGSLSEYMEPRKMGDSGKNKVLIENLTQRHLVQFAWQVATGMQYMASRKVVHRDLAARNVLVTENFVMKISDFGLSRDLHYKHYYRKKGRERIPFKWMAMESLEEAQITTIESDVWSFGILLWEIMTLGGTPYPSIPMQDLFKCLQQGYRMESPHNCPEEVYQLMQSCWLEKPEKRPTFKTIVDYFEWMLAAEASFDTEEQDIATHKSSSSDDLNGERTTTPSEGSTIMRRKRRPLSAPVFLPSDPQHSICDEDECIPAPSVDAPYYPDGTSQPFYSNNSNHYSTPAKLLVRQRTDPDSELPGDYHDPRPVASVIAPSVDSAIGSPAWHLADINYAVPFLGEHTTAHCDPSYVNIRKHQQSDNTRFPFPPPTVNLRSNRLADIAMTDSQFSNLYGKTNQGFMPSPNPCLIEKKEELGRRYSDESRSSSGRGGSSAVSSAEGLGGLSDFCKIEGVQLPLRDVSEQRRIGNDLRFEAIDNLISKLSGSI